MFFCELIVWANLYHMKSPVAFVLVALFATFAPDFSVAVIVLCHIFTTFPKLLGKRQKTTAFDINNTPDFNEYHIIQVTLSCS